MAENFFGITDRGRIRDNNEDTFIAERLSDNNLIAACVIDGVGGYEGGEIAARIAKETIEEYLRNTSGNSTGLGQSFILANEKIYNDNQQRAQPQPMACVLTLAIADVGNNQLHYAHVGDTRLYLLRDQSLVKLTKDQSFVGFLEDSGRLSEEEAMRHPKRNEIDKALGFDPQIQLYTDYIETGSSPFLPGDMLLLCSDGLTDMVTNSEITSILTSKKTLNEKGKALIDAANAAGGKDNITVVLVQNDKKPIKQKAAKPARHKKNDGSINERVSAHSTAAQETTVAKPRRGRGRTAIALLSVLCVALLAALLWQLLKSDHPAEKQAIAVKKDRNADQLKLQTILDGGKTKLISLNDSLISKTVLLNDTLFIGVDTLHLNGNGITLRADSAYTGPGVFIIGSSKYITLENIILENFDIGVLAQNKSALFMNVQFRNCRVWVQYQPTSPDIDHMNGAIINDTTFQMD